MTLRAELSRALRDWLESVRRFGPLAIGAFPLDRVRIRRAERAEAFDAQTGTDTAAAAYPWRLPGIGDARTGEIHCYEAIPAWLLREILSSLPLRPDTFTFLDMGSGKGRTLLVASEFPFKKIIGVELAPELHRIAQRNVELYEFAPRRRSAISLRCMNAVDYEFGAEPVVLFMYNPFGKASMRRVLARLEMSLLQHPREAYIVYVNPRFSALLRGTRFRKIRAGGSWWRPWNRYVIYRALPQARS